MLGTNNFKTIEMSVPSVGFFLLMVAVLNEGNEYKLKFSSFCEFIIKSRIFLGHGSVF